MKIAMIIGAATPPGRLVQAVRQSATYARSQGNRVRLVNLEKVQPEYCDGRPLHKYNAVTRRAVAAVRQADGVIIASPVYRATYTGILKNFLDILPIETLEGKPVGILAMGGSNHHCLGVDWQLRCTLAWFGAIVTPTSVYITPQDFSSGKPKSVHAITELRELVATLVTLSGHVHSIEFRPRPLAASV